mmetsp:Transcript_9851/g.22053  ORF Transcript_9851/g.22053 Transcript_9851/m.22053 type:complete len:228 (-) Transcript_9851:335-1018(-)
MVEAAALGTDIGNVVDRTRLCGFKVLPQFHYMYFGFGDSSSSICSRLLRRRGGRDISRKVPRHTVRMAAVRIHDSIGLLKGKVEQPVHIPKVRGLIGFRKVYKLKSNVVLSLFDSMTNVHGGKIRQMRTLLEINHHDIVQELIQTTVRRYVVVVMPIAYRNHNVGEYVGYSLHRQVEEGVLIVLLGMAVPRGVEGHYYQYPPIPMATGVVVPKLDICALHISESSPI